MNKLGPRAPYPQAAEPADADEVDLKRLLVAFRRRLVLFSSLVLLTIGIAAIIVFTKTPQYTATASVVIDQHKVQLLKDIESVLSDLPNDTSVVDTEIELIKSRSLAEKVTEQLHLDKDPDFMPEVRSGHPLSPEAFHNRVVDNVLDGLDAERAGTTNVIYISYEADDPETAARIANAYTDAYETSQLDVKFGANKRLNGALSTRLVELRKQVEDAEAAVEKYKSAHNLLSSQGATLTEQEISTLDQQVALARADQAAQEASLATAQSQLQNGSSGEDVGAALDSPVVQDLRRQIAEASQNVAQLASHYGERYPDLIKARGQLADLNKQLKAEISRIISNLEAKAEIARGRTASVEASTARVRSTLSSNNQASVALNELQRNADSAKTLYESFLDRYKETSSSQGLDAPDQRLVSPAAVPIVPSSPKKALDLSLGAAIGLLAGFIAIFIAEALNSGLATSEDVERQLGIAYLGSIPLLKSTLDREERSTVISPMRYILEKPHSIFSEGFRHLRAALTFLKGGKSPKVLAFTSALPGEGKTLTSLCFARIVALSGARPVVVDCDLRRRGINGILSSEPKNGLIEVLNGTATLNDALVQDEGSGAMFLPLAKKSWTSKEVFGSDAMRQLLDELRRRFDFVILDTPPVLAVADIVSISALADAVVLLTRWRKTPRKAIEAALRTLRAADALVAGIVLTQVDVRKQAKHGYGDGGYYYESYAKYYATEGSQKESGRKWWHLGWK